MKRILLAGATLLALTTAQPTLAADAPIYKGPAPRAEALFNWSGFYVGAQIGYLWGNADLFVAASNTYNINGVIGGAHIGYNWQLGSPLVFGVEADVNLSGAKGDDGGFGGTLDETRINWAGSLRGRLGFASGNWLFYGTAGWAWAAIKHTANVAPPESVTRTHNGWTAGGGVEVAVTPQWTTRIEYRFTDYGTETLVFPTATNRVIDVKTHQVTVGASVRF